jgi:hypothetical protein
MTPDEIRKHWNVQGSYPAELIGDFALVEIAAQLAELNSHLALLSSTVASFSSKTTVDTGGACLDVRTRER